MLMEISAAFMISCEYGKSSKWENIPLDCVFGMPDQVKKIITFTEWLPYARHSVKSFKGIIII